MTNVFAFDTFMAILSLLPPEDTLKFGLVDKYHYNLIFYNDRFIQFLKKCYVDPHLISIHRDPSLVTKNRNIVDYVKDLITRKRIAESLKEGHTFFVTGPAGTGKSHLLHELCKNFLPTKGEYNTASTGTAASEMSHGRTIHSLFNKFTIFDKEKVPHDPSGSAEYIKELAKRKVKRVREKSNAQTSTLQDIKTVRLDEVSMISYFYLQYLHEIMCLVKPSGDHTKPFAGVQLILSGDFVQLNPVPQQKPDNADTSKFVYECTFWNHIKVFHLRYSFRQMIDERHAELCYNLRHGIATKQDLELLNSRVIKDEKEIDPDAIHIYTTNQRVDTYNNESLNKIDSPVRQFPKNLKYFINCQRSDIASKYECQVPDFSDKQKIIKFISERTNTELKDGLFSKFKVGATAMITKNIDLNNGLSNGTHGTISDIFPHHKTKTPVIKFKIKKTGEEHQIDTIEKLIAEPCGCVILLEEVPVKLASAITAHKSQGMTLDSVHAVINDRTSAALIYVILTRVSSIKHITFGKDFSPKGISVDPKVKEFYKGERYRGPFILDDQSGSGDRAEETEVLDPLDVLKKVENFIDKEFENLSTDLLVKGKEEEDLKETTKKVKLEE